MEVRTFTTYLFGENTYIVFDPATREAAIIDPGMMSLKEAEPEDFFIQDNDLRLKYLINTHGHVDHVAGNEHIREIYNVPTYASLDDSMYSDNLVAQAKMFHLPGKFPERVVIDVPVKDGDVIPLGADSLKVIAVPGHSQGSIALYSAKSRLVFTGDALFLGSIGRTDLPGGNYNQLVSSIKERLLTLPDETIVYPGHGPATTIEQEKMNNPFLR